eukprot:12909647-Prorocentrum_lima.AAC.1
MEEADMVYQTAMGWDRWIGDSNGQPGMEHRQTEPHDTVGFWPAQIEDSEQAWCVMRGGGTIRMAAMGE